MLNKVLPPMWTSQSICNVSVSSEDLHHNSQKELHVIINKECIPSLQARPPRQMIVCVLPGKLFAWYVDSA